MAIVPRAVLGLSVLCAAITPACSLPRDVTGSFDGAVRPSDVGVPPVDAWRMPGTDAWTANDAWTMPGDDAYVAPVDAYVAPIDAYVPPVDAYVPPPDASGGCTSAYGGVSGYVECSSTTGTCSFYVNWPGSSTGSCADACGGRCVGGIGNVDRTSCTTEGSPFPCDQSFQDAICTCTP